MSGQLPLLNRIPGFFETERAKDAIEVGHNAAFKLVDAMRPKVAAAALGITDQALSKKRSCDDSRRLSLEELAILLVASDHDAAKECLNALAALIHCKPLEDEEPDSGYGLRLEEAVAEVLSPAALAEAKRKARGW